jgi:predicted membrane protein
VAEENKHRIDFGDEQSKRSTRGLVMDILDGSILTKTVFVQHLVYIFFLGALGIFYIGNRYHAERIIRETAKTEKELIDLRSEAVAVSSELLIWRNQSNIKKLLEERNIPLKPLVAPPKKLYIDD